MAPVIYRVKVHRAPVLALDRRGYVTRTRVLETRELDAVVSPKGNRVRVCFGVNDWREFYGTTGAAVSARMRDWMLDADDATRLRDAAEGVPGG